MAYKVNYGLERAERNRVKQAKKEAKLRDRKANAGNENVTPGSDAPEVPAAPDKETESG
jgi:hypothetical protein